MNANTKTMTASEFRHSFVPNGETRTVACWFGKDPGRAYAYHYGATRYATVQQEGSTWIARWAGFGALEFASRAKAFAWLRKLAKAEDVDVNRTANAFINCM